MTDLPEPAFLAPQMITEDRYSSAQMREAVAAERERCARLCEAELPSDQFAPVSQQTAGQHQMAAYLAIAIREPNVLVTGTTRRPGP